MKTEITETGWKEITTKNINITQFWDADPFRETVKEWIESNKRIGLYKKHRKVCGCCHTGWEKITGRIYFIATDKGNKIICGDCFNKLKSVIDMVNNAS